MAYYIYEAWLGAKHKATLHHADCPSCNHGSGPAPGSLASNLGGKWLGPFPSLREAASRHRAMHVLTRGRCQCV